MKYEVHCKYTVDADKARKYFKRIGLIKSAEELTDSQIVTKMMDLHGDPADVDFTIFNVKALTP